MTNWIDLSTLMPSIKKGSTDSFSANTNSLLSVIKCCTCFIMQLFGSVGSFAGFCWGNNITHKNCKKLYKRVKKKLAQCWVGLWELCLRCLRVASTPHPLPFRLDPSIHPSFHPLFLFFFSTVNGFCRGSVAAPDPLILTW